MNTNEDPTSRLRTALADADPSVRLAAVMAAGARPRDGHVPVLVARCAVEPDFFVRDMLTWALTRHDRSAVQHLVVAELGSPSPRARSQALHTLSKTGFDGPWSTITNHLGDADDEVARTAWRTAVALVPAGEERTLAEALVLHLGRGDADVQLSLSRCLVSLADAARSLVRDRMSDPDESVRAHATATDRLAGDPDALLDAAVPQARRARALHGAPTPDGGRHDG